MTSSWICVDVNLVVRLIADPQDTLVREQWQQWEVDGHTLAAPSLLYYDTANALYQYQRHGYLTAESVRLAQEAALSLPLTLHGDPELYREAVRLAQRLSLPATYDAHYLAVAERLGAELWTADKRLFQTVQDTLPWVRLITP